MVLAQAPCFQEVDVEGPASASAAFKMLKIKPGPSIDLRGRLPYAADAIASYEAFKRMKDRGLIAYHIRFQCAFPGAHDVIVSSFPDYPTWPILLSGTFPTYPVQPLDNFGLPVDLANSIQAASGGKIDYFHLPVMAWSDDAYFSTLSRLNVGDARVYLGLECNDGLEGMQRGLVAANKHLADFGVAHYFGYLWNEAALPDVLTTLAKGADNRAATIATPKV